MRGAAILAASALLVAAPAAAQQGSGTVVDAPFLLGAPEVEALASPTEVRLGQRFTLVVTAVHAADVVVNLPEPLDLGAGFEAGRKLSSTHPRSDGRKVREWQIELVAWELGELAIPPIQVTFTSAGRAGAVATRPVPVRVVGVLGDTDDPRLLRGPAPPIDLLRRDWRLVVAAGVAAAVVAIVLAALARRRRRAPSIAAARGPRRRLGPAADEALARLAEVEASGLLDRDQKAAYQAMSAVLRAYLGRRFGFSPVDLTTTDLRHRLEDAGLSPAVLGLSSHWLGDCDLVKYANHHATAGEARTALAGARDVVITTAAAVSASSEAASA